MALRISGQVELPESEIELQSIRAQGSGGQKVNKTSSAVHLRFDINASSLPEFYKQRLLGLRDSRISKEGVLIIKAQQYRTLEQNRQDAMDRLVQLIKDATTTEKVRRPTKPTRSSQRKRMDSKTKHSRLKQLRKRTDY
jgi:ribosome-associated protein